MSCKNQTTAYIGSITTLSLIIFKNFQFELSTIPKVLFIWHWCRLRWPRLLNLYVCFHWLFVPFTGWWMYHRWPVAYLRCQKNSKRSSEIQSWQRKLLFLFWNSLSSKLLFSLLFVCFYSCFKFQKLTTTENTITYHLPFVRQPKILHKHCFQFLLGPPG